MEQFQTVIQMGNQLLILGLEKLKDFFIQTTQMASSSYNSGLTQRELIDSSNKCIWLLSSIEKDMKVFNNGDQSLQSLNSSKDEIIAHSLKLK